MYSLEAERPELAEQAALASEASRARAEDIGSGLDVDSSLGLFQEQLLALPWVVKDDRRLKARIHFTEFDGEGHRPLCESEALRRPPMFIGAGVHLAAVHPFPHVPEVPPAPCARVAGSSQAHHGGRIS